MEFEIAPELEVSEWLNTDNPLSLLGLKGKVIVIEAFQMLCPGCVSHSLPQAMKVSRLFSPDDVAVIGLHTVFEHHGAQGSKEALSAFLHEYRITFPVAIDTASSSSPTPKTMTKYQMRGTPTLILIDRQGRLRKHHFGQAEDMAIGAEVMALVNEKHADLYSASDARDKDKPFDDNGCRLPD